MKVDVYKNLNDDCISVKAREGDDYGLVIDHADEVFVQDVEFVVQPGGRERVRTEDRKNVHAYVRGVRAPEYESLPEDGVAITYNPKKYDSFVRRADKTPVETARLARVTTSGVEAIL